MTLVDIMTLVDVDVDAAVEYLIMGKFRYGSLTKLDCFAKCILD